MNHATLTEAERRFFDRTRVARLATADESGQPYVVPIVFAIDSRRLYTPLDDKPKRVAPRSLKRVRNLSLNPQVAVVVDHYSEDWSELAWVLILGRGEIVERGEAHATGVRLLSDKYEQYRAMPLEHCPMIVITPVRITSWGKLM
jgi:PPOX class probable F420-dependent enzyme